MAFREVEGRDTGKEVTLFALFTCVWCRKTRRLLDSLGVAYRYVYVDMLEPAEKEKALEDMRRYNPDTTFPTLVVGDRVIRGFREKEIREALE